MISRVPYALFYNALFLICDFPLLNYFYYLNPVINYSVSTYEKLRNIYEDKQMYPFLPCNFV